MPEPVLDHFAAGFAGRSHFSRAFASAYGADPGSYRHDVACRPRRPSGGVRDAAQIGGIMSTNGETLQ